MNNTIGSKIKTIRLNKGYGLNEFAKKINISGSYLSNIENNKRNPTLETLNKISSALDIPLTELIDDELCNLDSESLIMQIGDILKNKRLEKGYSQKKLSEISGVSLSAIQKCENGIRNPKIETLNKIATALDVPLNELIDDKLCNLDSESLSMLFAPVNDKTEFKRFCDLLQLLNYKVNVGANDGIFRLLKDNKTVAIFDENKIEEISTEFINDLSLYTDLLINKYVKSK